MNILSTLTDYASPTTWIVFHVFIFLMLALDLGILNRKAHAPTPQEALGWSVLWVCLSLAYNGYVWFSFGSQAGVEFLTAYLLEKSLSVDNIFVFALIFTSFNVHMMDRHRILFWGVLGALIMRALMIIGGIELLQRFHWIIYIFGGFLVFTGAKMLLAKKDEDPTKFQNISKFIGRYLPLDPEASPSTFTILKNGKRFFTPLLVIIVTIELVDVVFAVDSIPAVLAISKNPFVVYTSNIFALLGLRALYFLIADSMNRFHYLSQGLAIILMWIGLKMIFASTLQATFGITSSTLTMASLVMIVGILVASIVLSIRKPKS